MVEHTLHFCDIFMDFFQVKVLAKSGSAHNQLQISFENSFSSKKTYSLHFSRIPTPRISKMLFLKLSILKGTPRPQCVQLQHISLFEHCIDVLHVFKVNCKLTVLGFLRSRSYFYWLIQTCHMDLVQCRCPKKAWIVSFPDGAKSIG